MAKSSDLLRREYFKHKSRRRTRQFRTRDALGTQFDYEAELLLRQLAEATPVLLWIRRVDQERVLYVNDAYERVTGLAADDLYSDQSACLAAILPEDRDIARVALVTPSTAGIQGSMRVLTVDNGVCWYSVNVYRVMDPDDGVELDIGLAIDVTQVHEQEEKVKLRNRELSLLNEVAAHLGGLISAEEVYSAIENLVRDQMDISSGLVLRCVYPDLLELAYQWGFSKVETTQIHTQIDSVDAELAREFLMDPNPITLRVAEHQFLRNLVPSHNTATRDIVTAVPIIAPSNELAGLIMFFSDQEIDNDHSPTPFYELLGRQMGVALETASLFDNVRQQRSRLQTLSRKLVNIQESERRVIALELHDEAGQALTAIRVKLSLLQEELDHEQDKQRVQEVIDLTYDVLESLRSLATGLRPAALDRAGLAPVLREYVESFAERERIVGGFDSSLGDAVLPSITEIVLYRIAQEALTNVSRHARARRVDVLLRARKGSIVLIIEDDGVGFDPSSIQQEGHLGLLSMQERAEMVGGRLKIETQPGAGTTIIAEVPIADSSSSG